MYFPDLYLCVIENNKPPTTLLPMKDKIVRRRINVKGIIYISLSFQLVKFFTFVGLFQGQELLCD